MDQFLGFKYTMGIWFILELLNCLVPLYTENLLTEQNNNIYHENIGCFCQWNKEKFVYDETKNRWILLEQHKLRRSFMSVKTLSEGTCSLCGIGLENIVYKSPDEKQVYCSSQCLETDKMVSRADNEE